LEIHYFFGWKFSTFLTIMEAAKGTAGRQYNLAIEFFMPDWSLTMYPMPAECGYT
jgi:hypothetical protein